MLGLSGTLCAMKREAPTDKPEQEAKIARVAFPETLKLQDLPDDLLRLIIMNLSSAKGATEKMKLYKAAESIRSLMMTNSRFAQYLNDINFNGNLILELARRYTNHNVVEAAIALATQAGGKWLNSYIANEPADLRKEDDTDVVLVALQAITQGQEGVLNFLLYNYPEIAQRLSGAYAANGNTFFIESLYRNNRNIIKALIDAGVDINVRARAPAPGLTPGSSALAIAISLDRPDIAALLIEAEADVNAPAWTATDEEGTQELLLPLVWAIRQRDRASFKRLLSHPEIDIDLSLHGFTPLFYAAQYFDLEGLSDLLQAHANPNIINDTFDQEDEDKRTVLMYAAGPVANPELARVRTQMIELLLRYGADVNLGAGAQFKPLMAAAYYRPDLVPLFIKAGAEVNAQESSGKTALFFAVQAANADAVEQLIKAGADIMHALPNGKTIFEAAQELASGPAKNTIIKLLEERRAELGV